METSLVEYGLQTEETDWRVHVCFKVERIYWYRTKAGLKALNEKKGKPRTAYQQGRVTARGRVVPWQEIEGCREHVIDPDILQRWRVTPDADESEKGHAAKELVLDTIHRKHEGKLVPLRDVTNRREQLDGNDVVAFGERIQVKCDYNGGDKTRSGTGNLFLQTHECNPEHKH